MDFHRRTAVVTGAASGIGRALARELGNRGAHLVLADRDVGGLQRTAEETGGLAVSMDVSSPQDTERLAEVAGFPTLLCLNAGVVSPCAGPVWEVPADEWRRVMDINLGGVVNGLRSFVPRMLADGQPGHVLITASLAGLATWPGGGPYAASKHAVVAVAEQAALALQDHDIGVTVLCPALVRTGMSATGDDPEQVAGDALEAVDRGTFIVVPEAWQEAVIERGHRLAAAQRPALPTPQDAVSGGVDSSDRHGFRHRDGQTIPI